MKKIACADCAGTGQIMGMGMMNKDCPNCDGIGKIIHHEDEIGYLTEKMKSSDGYQSAKKRLMDQDETITNEKADELLEEAFEKERPKRGRPSK